MDILILKILFPTENFCYFCKEETPYLPDKICTDCKDRIEVLNRKFSTDDLSVENIYAAVSYNSYVREFIHRFKFRNSSYLYKPFAILMKNAMDANDLTDFDLIVSVPIHWRKEAIRGYNQSALLASEISNLTGIEYNSKSLIKHKWTKEQNRLSKTEREINLKGSFAVRDRNNIVDKRILLVDDLYTTGNTIKTCARVLSQAGAKSVTGLVLATMNG